MWRHRDTPDPAALAQCLDRVQPLLAATPALGEHFVRLLQTLLESEHGDGAADPLHRRVLDWLRSALLVLVHRGRWQPAVALVEAVRCWAGHAPLGLGPAAPAEVVAAAAAAAAAAAGPQDGALLDTLVALVFARSGAHYAAHARAPAAPVVLLAQPTARVPPPPSVGDPATPHKAPKATKKRKRKAAELDADVAPAAPCAAATVLEREHELEPPGRPSLEVLSMSAMPRAALAEAHGHLALAARLYARHAAAIDAALELWEVDPLWRALLLADIAAMEHRLEPAAAAMLDLALACDAAPDPRWATAGPMILGRAAASVDALRLRRLLSAASAELALGRRPECRTRLFRIARQLPVEKILATASSAAERSDRSAAFDGPAGRLELLPLSDALLASRLVELLLAIYLHELAAIDPGSWDQAAVRVLALAQHDWPRYHEVVASVFGEACERSKLHFPTLTRHIGSPELLEELAYCVRHRNLAASFTDAPVETPAARTSTRGTTNKAVDGLAASIEAHVFDLMDTKRSVAAAIACFIDDEGVRLGIR